MRKHCISSGHSTLIANQDSKTAKARKRNLAPLAASVLPVLAVMLPTTTAQAANKFWDINGTTAGATDDGGGVATGTWDNALTNWGDTNGTAATVVWVANDTPVFSAGTNATGASVITVSGAQSVSGITFEEGNVTLTGSAITLTTATINSGVNSHTIASDLTGALGLTKTGAGTLLITGNANPTGTLTLTTGTLTLSGANGFTGATTLTTGTLNLDYTTNNNDKISSTGLLTMGAGSTLNIQGVNGAANTSQTVNGVSLSTNGVSSINITKGDTQDTTLAMGAITRAIGSFTNFTTAGGPGNAIITTSTSSNGIVGGYATFASNDWAGVSGGNVTALASYDTNDFTGAGTKNTDVTSDQGPAADIAVNSLRMNTGAGPITLTLSGTANSITTGGILVTGGNTSTITGGTLTSGALDLAIIHNGTGNLTLGSDITGAIGVSKTGTGTLILSGSSSATLAHTVVGGTLRLGAAERITDTAAVNVNAGATFDMNSNAESVGSIAGAGEYVVSGALTVANTANTTVSGPITGSGGSITKNGTSTMTLSGSNSYGGVTTINTGVIAASNAASLGVGGSASDNTVVTATGAALQVSGTITLTEHLTLNGTGVSNAGALRKTANNTTTINAPITIASSGTRINSDAGTLSIPSSASFTGSSGNNLIIGGAGNTTVATNMAIGAGTLTKDGAGTLTLSANNSGWSGKIFVNGGVLAWSSDNGFTNNLGATPGAFTSDYITVDGGTLRMTTADTSGTSFSRSTRGILLTPNGGTVDMSSTATGAKAIYQGVIGLTGATGTLTKMGAGEFRYQSLSATQNTSTTGFTKLALNGGLFRLGSVTGFNFETALGAAPTALLTDGITFNGGQLGSSFNVTLNANRGVVIGSGGGTFLGTSGVTFNIPSPLSGTGQLIVGLPTATSFVGAVTLNNATNNANFTGSLQVNLSTLTLSQSLTASNLTGIFNGTSAGTISIASGMTLTVGGDGTSTSYPGEIIGAGRVTKVGTGTLTMSTVGGNDWTNTGQVNVNDGTLLYTALSALADTVPVTVNSPGILDMASVSDTIGTLAGSGTIANMTSLTTGANGSTTFSGTILAGAGTFTKNGTGTLTISGSNAYTGTTTIGGGTFRFGGTLGSIDPASAVVDNATLTFNRTNGMVFPNTISGTGQVIQLNATGVTTLTGTNTYDGGTTITGGTLIANDVNLGSALSGITWNGGTFQPAAAMTTARNTTVNATNGTIDATGNPLTINGAGNSTWIGNLTISGGTVNLARTGGTPAVTAGARITINAGATLNLSDSDSTSASGVSVNVTNNSTATFNVTGGTHNVGNIDGVGNTNVSNAAILNANYYRQNAVDVGGTGIAKVRTTLNPLDNPDVPTPGTGAGASVLNSLPTVAGGAMFDLNDGKLIVQFGTNASPVVATRAAIILGRGGTDFGAATWQGTGGISSDAAAVGGTGDNGVNPGDGISFAIGYVENSFLPALGLSSYTEFGGQTVDSGSMLIRFTRGADCNLDGKVNTDDVTIVGATFGTTNAEWSYGDFDYDGVVDSDDVTVLGALYDATAPALSQAQLASQFGGEFAAAFARGQAMAAVPEPTALSLLGLGGLAMLKRRRRSN